MQLGNHIVFEEVDLDVRHLVIHNDPEQAERDFTARINLRGHEPTADHLSVGRFVDPDNEQVVRLVFDACPVLGYEHGIDDPSDREVA